MSQNSDDPGRLARFGELPPPAELESRVIRSLEERGNLRPGGMRSWTWIARSAAAVVLFTAGWLTGALSNRRVESDSDTPRYALLLYEGAAPGVDDVAEMGEWIRGLRARGHYVLAEKLADTPVGPEAGIPAPGGLVIVSAASAEEANAIAQSSPHLRNGGRILIRPIEPT